MDGYFQIALKDLLEQYGEDSVKPILSTFSCPLNPDLQNFLCGKSAIDFAKQNIAPTHLIFASHKESPVLVGYFTLALKSFTIKNNSTCLSKSLKKKIQKFATYIPELDCYQISAPLIGQLGKNFTNGYNKLITGDELLKMACDKIAMVQQSIGGKVVYIECEDKPKLLEFYESNGFVPFSKRPLDKDEKNDLSGEYLIQMLKYIK